MRVVAMYAADDGTIFDTPEAAEKRDREAALFAELPSPLGTGTREIPAVEAAAQKGHIPGVLAPSCAQLGCYLVRTDDCPSDVCNDGCRMNEANNHRHGKAPL